MAALADAASTRTTITDLIAREEVRFLERQPRSAEMGERARGSPGRGSNVELDDRPPRDGVDQPRPRVEGLRRRRHGVRRPARRLRRHARRPRPPGGRRSGRAACPARHPLRPADRGRHRRRRGAVAAASGCRSWRFCNSGTEATMDAVHLMRAITGRDLIIKIEGSYHGHHDAVMVAATAISTSSARATARGRWLAGRRHPAGHGRPRRRRPVQRPGRARAGAGRGPCRQDRRDDHGAADDERRHRPADSRATSKACADLTRGHGVLLAYDEVKTGLTVGPGGATALLGVQPDIVCLAKALGGGVPCGAIGGTAEVMEAIADGTYEQVGTFNGNPLTMAAARADAHRGADARGLRALRARSAGGCWTGRWPPWAASGRRPTGTASGPRAASSSTRGPSGTTASSWPSTATSATPTGSSSTTAACSCRRGARASSGRCRRSTRMEDVDRFVANVERMTEELSQLDCWTPDPSHHGFF